MKERNMISRKTPLYLPFICLFIFSLGGTNLAAGLNGLNPGDPAPDFQVRLLDGKEFFISMNPY